MILTILIILIVLYIFGYIQIPALGFPDFPLFIINEHQITLWELLIFGVIIWAITALPSPFRQIVSVIFLLWILSLLGIIAITGVSNILIVAIIAAIIIALLN